MPFLTTKLSKRIQKELASHNHGWKENKEAINGFFVQGKKMMKWLNKGGKKKYKPKFKIVE